MSNEPQIGNEKVGSPPPQDGPVLARAARERRKSARVFVVFAVTGVCGLILLMLVVGSKQPSVYVLLSITRNVDLLPETDSNSAVRDADEFPALQKRLAVLVTTNRILDKVLADKTLFSSMSVVVQRDDAREWLREHIQVDYPVRDILRISVDGVNAKEAVPLVNALASAFVSEQAGDEGRARSEKLNILERILDEKSSTLRIRKEAQLRLKESQGVRTFDDGDFKALNIIVQRLQLKLEILKVNAMAPYRLRILEEAEPSKSVASWGFEVHPVSGLRFGIGGLGNWDGMTVALLLSTVGLFGIVAIMVANWIVSPFRRRISFSVTRPTRKEADLGGG